MKRLVVLVLLLLPACGGSPSAPSTQPTPTPTPVPAPQPSAGPTTVRGTITDTVSKAVIGTFEQPVSGLPATVTVSAAGHITRQTRVGTTSPTVDLISTSAPFSQEYYNQLVRGTLENQPQPLTRLTSSPSIYLQTRGMTQAGIAAYENAARAVVPALSGGQLTVLAFDVGDGTRPESNNWIVVEQIKDDNESCGRSFVGSSTGHIWMNTASKCARNGEPVGTASLFAHELGHALGFWHVDVPTALMHPTVSANTVATEPERFHAAIAYQRPVGNRDPDIDAPTATPLRRLAIE